MKKIPLTQGKFALVDDEDFECLNQFSWQHLVTGGGKKSYAKSYGVVGGKLRKVFTMHRMIMGFPEGMDVDHRDGNGLNNQKSNLRICTKSQNNANTEKQKSNTSGYKGVAWHKPSGKWLSNISHNNRKIHIGTFHDIVEAAKAYDKKAKELFGDFAKLNFSNK